MKISKKQKTIGTLCKLIRECHEITDSERRQTAVLHCWRYIDSILIESTNYV